MAAGTLGRDLHDDTDRVRPIVGLHAAADAAGWYREQAGLGVQPWEAPEPLDVTDPAALDRWVAAAAAHLEEYGERVHLLATGEAAYAAILLGARRPELTMSLLLGDPAIEAAADPDEESYRDLLRQVVAPTLVIASAPGAESDPEVGAEVSPEFAVAQSIAGGIDNGVFVVVDGCRVPAHRERGSSFNEWVTSFTTIAEGLVALTQQRQEELRA